MTAALFAAALICTAAGGLCTGLAIARANARQTVSELAEWASHERRYGRTLSRIVAEQHGLKAAFEEECG